MLDPHWCRERQRRLLSVLRAQSLDAVVLGHPRHVYYLSNHLPHWLQHAGLILRSDGRTWLVTANKPDPIAAVESCDIYDAQWNATQRSDQPATVAASILSYLKEARAKRIGLDASAVTSKVALSDGIVFESLDRDIGEMRRFKYPDELALMRVAIRCTGAMYERARELIEPGVPEITVFNELHGSAVREAGEPMTAHLGNDYACGVAGGPPRKEYSAKKGQIYILDLGPSYRGYFADNARSFAVDRKPTDAQLKAWEAIVGVFPMIERMVKPGVRCRNVFAAASEHLEQATGQSLSHHLGHGVGLEPHEGPHLNPKWDDEFVEGDVFTAEPGLYGPQLAGGIRIENQYRVGTDGVENLTPFPLGLC